MAGQMKQRRNGQYHLRRCIAFFTRSNVEIRASKEMQILSRTMKIRNACKIFKFQAT